MWNWQLFKDWIFKYIWEKRKIEQRVKERERTCPQLLIDFPNVPALRSRFRARALGRKQHCSWNPKLLLTSCMGVAGAYLFGPPPLHHRFSKGRKLQVMSLSQEKKQRTPVWDACMLTARLLKFMPKFLSAQISSVVTDRLVFIIKSSNGGDRIEILVQVVPCKALETGQRLWNMHFSSLACSNTIMHKMPC